MNPRVASTLFRPCLNHIQSRLLEPALPETLLEGVQNATAKLFPSSTQVTGRSPHLSPQQLFIYLCFKPEKQDLNCKNVSGFTCPVPLPLTHPLKSYVTWCPTVFLCSLLAALIAGLAERTLILDVPFPMEVVDAASFSSWNKSATI